MFLLKLVVNTMFLVVLNELHHLIFFDSHYRKFTGFQLHVFQFQHCVCVCVGGGGVMTLHDYGYLPLEF